MSARMRSKIAVAAALILGLVAWDFAAATTFLGDDYLFLAFARLEPQPLVAFVRDMHGGEYYRPVPMLVWALLDRVGQGGGWPFALLGFLLHTGNAALTVALGRALGFHRQVAWLAGILFLLAPAEREAALWFSASTDLLATAATLGSLLLLLRASTWARLISVLLAAVAYFSKETALLLPLLAMAVLWAQEPRRLDWRKLVRPVLPHALVAVGYGAARFAVLRGVGGSNDPLAPWWGRALQMLGGLVHAVTAYQPLPEGVAWLLGAIVLVGAGVGAWRSGDRARFPLLWIALALLPLPAAGWVVGARYFYLPAVGLMLLLALALHQRGPALQATTLGLLAALGLASTTVRSAEVDRYRALLATARQAVSAGDGHVFLVRGAIKDLDLALKLTTPATQLPHPLLVIPDVPASFVWMPEKLAARAAFLLAQPPLPPSGAYRFGGQRIVGLARRQDAPDLDDVLARLPDLRILALVPSGDGFTWHDVTPR
jgi:hypothetical protein